MQHHSTPRRAVEDGHRRADALADGLPLGLAGQARAQLVQRLQFEVRQCPTVHIAFGETNNQPLAPST